MRALPVGMLLVCPRYFLRFLECFWSVNEERFICVRPILSFHKGIFIRPLWRADHWLHP